MARFWSRLCLLGLALPGHVFSLPRDGMIVREADPLLQLDARMIDVDVARREPLLEKRVTTITTDVAVITQFSTLGVADSSTTVVSSTATSVVTTTAAASSSASPSSSSAPSSGPPSTTGASNTANSGTLSTPSPSPTPSPAPTSGGGLSGGAIAGIVIGVVAALAIAAALGYLIARRKRANQRAASTGTSAWQAQGGQDPHTQQPMKEAVNQTGVAPGPGQHTGPYAGPSANQGVYTSVTSGYTPGYSELSAEPSAYAASGVQQQPAKPWANAAAPESPQGMHEMS